MERAALRREAAPAAFYPNQVLAAGPAVHQRVISVVTWGDAMAGPASAGERRRAREYWGPRGM